MTTAGRQRASRRRAGQVWEVWAWLIVGGSLGGSFGCVRSPSLPPSHRWLPCHPFHSFHPLPRSGGWSSGLVMHSHRLLPHITSSPPSFSCRPGAYITHFINYSSSTQCS
ncbi:hypothetical protein BGZ63DRAFT_380260 [Mariannaea sp. PMI_226]|nr:hypothetical protein BGZ63DRAFT_380260 [Mariannaea sp. PMI_226]